MRDGVTLSEFASDDMPTLAEVRPASVRYIKLGEGGHWEPECFKRGIVRFGFGTSEPERFQLCQQGRWAELARAFEKDGKTKGVATRFANESRDFFLDEGSTLWITFMGRTLQWGFCEPEPPQAHEDGNGVYRRIRGGWTATDLHGERLTMDRLSGALTQLASYRGTSCSVKASDYVIRRINGTKLPQVQQAVAVQEAMWAALVPLMRMLVPQDFELLVELVFAASGYRRIEIVGKTQKTIDLDLELPITGKRSFVQVKSRTSTAELARYVELIEEQYDEMFFVFHTGSATTHDDRVTVIGPDALARRVFDAGLSDWLIRKVS
jgi:hypothetical protein